MGQAGQSPQPCRDWDWSCHTTPEQQFPSSATGSLCVSSLAINKPKAMTKPWEVFSKARPCLFSVPGVGLPPAHSSSSLKAPNQQSSGPCYDPPSPISTILP